MKLEAGDVHVSDGFVMGDLAWAVLVLRLPDVPDVQNNTVITIVILYGLLLSIYH